MSLNRRLAPFVPASGPGHAHMARRKRECSARGVKSGATAFPPPPCGGGTGRGVQQAQRLFLIRCRTNAAPRLLIFRNLSAETASRTVPCRHPLPVAPPQGGREPCGTHLRNSSAAKL